MKRVRRVRLLPQTCSFTCFKCFSFFCTCAHSYVVYARACAQSIDRALSPSADGEVIDEAAERHLNPLTSAGLTDRAGERIRKQI